MRDRFGIFGTVTRFRELSPLLVMMLRIPNNGSEGGPRSMGACVMDETVETPQVKGCTPWPIGLHSVKEEKKKKNDEERRRREEEGKKKEEDGKE